MIMLLVVFKIVKFKYNHYLGDYNLDGGYL